MKIFFSNGKMDIVIYNLKNIKSVGQIDKLVKEVTNKIESRVGRDYAIIHKGEEKVAFNGNEFINVNRILQDDPVTEESARFIRMTPTLLAALLSIIFFFTVMFVATMSLANLNTPALYVEKPLPHGKVQY